MAERLGTISEPGIHRWETGRTRPSVDILPRLATTLGVSIEALVHAIVATPRRQE
jgi:transcriptional regulator with XRE-family HTH domain